MGHVQAGAVPAEGSRHDVPGHQYRRTRTGSSDLTKGDIGRLGEAIAAVFLQRHGLRIADRNVRIERGEIDLIAIDAGRSVVVEVKTVVSRGEPDLHPEDAFSEEKARTVRRLANRLELSAHRVDLVAVSLIESGARVRWLRSVA